MLVSAPITTAMIGSDAVGGTQIADGGVDTADLANIAVTSGKIANGTIQPVDLNVGGFGTTFWKTDGNAGTTTGTHFVGTTDNQAVDLRVNNARALRLQPNSTSPNLIGGHGENLVGIGVAGAVIAGGGDALELNQVIANFGVIGGGSGHAIAGGIRNSIDTNAFESAIAGGRFNKVEENSYYGFIGGGLGNRISSPTAFIGGGLSNTVRGLRAVISGGEHNNILDNAYHAVIGGGEGNFVWPDAQRSVIAGGAANHVFIDGEYAAIGGARLPAGGNAWEALSDRNAKENFRSVDGLAVLEKIAAMPMTTWNYKTQYPAIRHIGPMAQDFHAAFGVGEDDRHSSTIDDDGVALAAIQGLNQKVEQKNAAIAELKHELEKLKQVVDKLANANH